MRSTTFLPTRKLNSLIQQQQQSNRIAEVEKEVTDESRGDQEELPHGGCRTFIIYLSYLDSWTW